MYITILILGCFFIVGISFSGYKAYKILNKKDKVVVSEHITVEEYKNVDIDELVETSTDFKYLNNLLNTVNADIKMLGEIPEFLELRDKILKRMSELKTKIK